MSKNIAILILCVLILALNIRWKIQETSGSRVVVLGEPAEGCPSPTFHEYVPEGNPNQVCVFASNEYDQVTSLVCVPRVEEKDQGGID